MSDDLEAKLHDWLEKSGRALELRVARALQRHERIAHVNQARSYLDVVSEQQREGDVLGVFRWRNPRISGTLQLAIECKSGQDHPWVAFYQRDHIYEPTLMPSGAWPPQQFEAFRKAWCSKQGLAGGMIATHIVSAFSGAKNHAQDAVRQAVSFARAEGKNPRRYYDDPPGIDPATVVVPVVVTQAPLFTCELLPSGDLKVDPVEHLAAWCYYSNRGDRVTVYVRSEKALEPLVDEAGDALVTATEVLSGRHSRSNSTATSE